MRSDSEADSGGEVLRGVDVMAQARGGLQLRSPGGYVLGPRPRTVGRLQRGSGPCRQQGGARAVDIRDETALPGGYLGERGSQITGAKRRQVGGKGRDPEERGVGAQQLGPVLQRRVETGVRVITDDAGSQCTQDASGVLVVGDDENLGNVESSQHDVRGKRQGKLLAVLVAVRGESGLGK